MRSLIIILFLFCGGCQVARPGLDEVDMASSLPHDRCRGPRDNGHTVWWDGENEPIGFPFPHHVRYVCVDHGPQRDGWWFEARPEIRYMP